MKPSDKATRRWTQLKFVLRFSETTLRNWLSKKVLFTVLPVVIVAMVAWALCEDNREIKILLAPEWSFAAIVLYDAAIGKLMFLATNRHFPNSFSSYARMLLIPLILSAVIFLFAILNREGTGFKFDEQFLIWAQIILFSLAAVMSYGAEILDTAIIEERNRIPEWMARSRYYTYLESDLSRIEKSLQRVESMVVSFDKMQFPNYGDSTARENWNQDQRRVIVRWLEQIDEKTTKVHTQVADWESRLRAKAIDEE